MMGEILWVSVFLGGVRLEIIYGWLAPGSIAIGEFPEKTENGNSQPWEILELSGF